MAKVQPTTSITIQETTLQVADLEPDHQRIVQLLDEWRQDEEDEGIRLQKTRAALHDIQNTLLSILQPYLEEKPSEEAQEVFEAEPVDE